MYVDESGDTGHDGSPTKYFVLSALVIHESNWQNLLDDVVGFKRLIKSRYGLLMKEEIHASVFLSKRLKLSNTISRNNRLDLLKKTLDWVNQRNDVSVFSVRVDKTMYKGDVFEYAWKALIQRFDNTISYNNFPGSEGINKGIIVCDNTDGGKLTKLLRQMRHFNNVPNDGAHPGGYKNIPLRAIVEDPIFRDSRNSFILQIVDVIAYFAKQSYEPNKYVRKKGAKTFYGRLGNVINPHVTRYGTQYNIVEL